MCGHFKDEVLKACDEVCGKKTGRKSEGDTWWWNEEVKESAKRKKEANKAMCQDSTAENKRRYKSMKNKAMREKAEEYQVESWDWH